MVECDNGIGQRGREIGRREWGRALLATLGGAWISAAVTVTAGGPGPRLRETRPTLDPGRFVGRAREAHQVARDIPAVLDQLYCYCGCDKSAGHKTLLSCFTDGHAPT